MMKIKHIKKATSLLGYSQSKTRCNNQFWFLLTGGRFVLIWRAKIPARNGVLKTSHATCYSFSRQAFFKSWFVRLFALAFYYRTRGPGSRSWQLEPRARMKFPCFKKQFISTPLIYFPYARCAQQGRGGGSERIRESGRTSESEKDGGVFGHHDL